MTPQVLDWNQAFQAGAVRCGGKGYNLARLARYGFNLPAGGVLTAEAYAELVNRPDLARLAGELVGVGADETLAAPRAEKLLELRTSIGAARLPAAVRAELARFMGERSSRVRWIRTRSSWRTGWVGSVS